MPTLPANNDLQRFLEAVWPDLDGRWLLFWGAPSKRSSWVQSITPDELAAIDIWAAKENVYLGCALRSANLGPTLRGEKADCVAIPGVWADLDYAEGGGHKKPNLPQTEDDAMRLLAEMGPPPSIIVHSGRGLQAWWIFKEPWAFESDDDRAKAEALTKGWCSTLRARAKVHGWDADQVGDLTRVMRLPGTWNRKGVPKKTRLLELNEHRYEPSDLEGYLLPETEEKAQAANLTWAFDLNPAAEPPADKFMRLCEIDQAFKSAWEHSRTDLQDQSASSYDLSLATKALAASWTGQEVVNLLIAHRRRHNADLKLRKDYYERTLNLAMTGKGVEERRALVESIKNGQALPEHVAKDPAELLALVSSELGVSLTKFVRYRGDGNTYEMEVNGRTVSAGGIEDFDSQTRFRRLLLDHTDVRIASMKADRWDEVVQRLFQAIENVDVEIGTKKGTFENWLEVYLSSSGIQGQEKWMDAAIMGNPFRLDGEVYIVSETFRQFLIGKMNERMTSKQLSFTMTQLGYVHERKNVKSSKGGNATKRSVWKIHDFNTLSK